MIYLFASPSGLQHLRKAVEIFRISQGPEHDETGEAECHLGQALLTQSPESQEGRELLHHGSRMLQQKLGDEHPKVIKWQKALE